MSFAQKLLDGKVFGRALHGGQRVTRKTLNSLVGKNNFAWQELRPPMANELATGLQSILRAPTNLASGKLNVSGMTTTEAAQYALVFAEIYCWFIVGECIGKGGIVGYWV
ncbi:unnamed protein product [Oikopleura dioica]|uniref:ATP synthase subunit n=1 Tax=Oikopleura dioica TaxID=34765 RepID=E4WWW6_OIKDI|nr:unnamed protein product [Oikopleura dioica]